MKNDRKNRSGFHPKNIHKKGYDFSFLVKVNPDLAPWLFVNNYGNKTMDFGNPKAVKVLNHSLLMAYYDIGYWEFSEDHLCPPIPSRADYVHHIAELISEIKIVESPMILDIGTGANAIYPLLGSAIYDWKFVGTDIDRDALLNAKEIFHQNQRDHQLAIRFQKEKGQIFKGIVKDSDRFYASMCNPPFYKSIEEAERSHQRKLKGLGRQESSARNFGGKHHELVFKGGEKAFLHTYLYESSFYKEQCNWFTILVSKKEYLKSMFVSLEKLGAKSIKALELKHGNKISRIVAWTFLHEEKQGQMKKL